MMQQSASQLSYCLLDCRTDLRPLRILASRELIWEGWTVGIHVLGASHAVEFRRGAECVTELLTCVRPEYAQSPPIALQADTPGESCTSLARITCRVRLKPFDLAIGDALIGAFDTDCRLEVAFPFAGDGAAPVTRIGWRVSGDSLAIETVHSYPEEGRAVRSESHFVSEDPQL